MPSAKPVNCAKNVAHSEEPNNRLLRFQNSLQSPGILVVRVFGLFEVIDSDNRTGRQHRSVGSAGIDDLEDCAVISL